MRKTGGRKSGPRTGIMWSYANRGKPPGNASRPEKLEHGTGELIKSAGRLTSS